MGEAKLEEIKAEEPKPEEKKEKPEEKKEEQAEEKKEEASTSPPPPPSPVILFVDLHCVGCAKKIERCIMKCRGLEEVKIDMVQNQVTVKGIVDPQVLCSRIQKKTMKNAKVLSPPPPEDGHSSKSEVSGITTVELLVNMHCEACAQQLKRKILKMRGVQTADTELKASKVTVTGTMSAKKLVESIHRRTGKLAKIVRPPPPPPPTEEEKKEEAEKKEEEKPPEEKKEEKLLEEKKEESAEKKEEEKAAEKPPENADGGSKEEKVEEKKEAEPPGGGIVAMTSEEDMVKRMMYWTPAHVIELLPPPQIFSDENPNACCIS